MMIIGTFEDLKAGQIITDGFLTDIHGQPRQQPYVVMGPATYEEWKQQFIEESGHPPPEWMDIKAKKDGKFFKIHTD